MLTFIARHFIDDHKNYSLPRVRTAYGMICGVLGIVFNLILFAAKLIVGLIGGSIAIVADAVNNLSDASSSLIMLIGFRLSSQKPDPEHPFGHRRIEYVSGLIVSVIIISMGLELGKTSVEKIIDPTLPSFEIFTAVVLVLSIMLKLYMFVYNGSTAKKISSEAMRATAFDSLSDAASTLAVLVSMLLAEFFSVAADGWCGILVSAFIIFSGIKAISETVNPLLGQSPDPELVKKIERLVRECDKVSGIHDMIIHSYGPGVMFVSLHAEVPADGDLLVLHDAIDRIERRIEEELDCRAVIHMDPVETDNEHIIETRHKVEELVRCIDDRLTLHDFRMVSGSTHTKVIFDIAVPYEMKMSDKALTGKVERMIRVLDPNYFAVIDIDKTFV